MKTPSIKANVATMCSTGTKSVFVTVMFHRPGYHGLRDNRSVDWPPSPTRLVGALVSGANNLETDDKERALAGIGRIVQAPAPLIYVPSAVDLNLPDTYTQKSGLDAAGRPTAKNVEEFLDLSLIQMNTKSRTAKPTTGVSLTHPTVIFEIDVDLDQAELEALTLATQYVGYFGRSNDPADLLISESRPTFLDQPGHFQVLTPIPSTVGLTRGWTPQTLVWMDLNFERLFQPNGCSHLALPPVPATGYIQPLRYVEMQQDGELELVPLLHSVKSHRVPELFSMLYSHLKDIDVEEVDMFPVVNAGNVHSDGRCFGVGFTPKSSLAKRGDGALVAQTVASEVAPLLWEEQLLSLQTGPTPQEDSWTLNPARWRSSSARWVSATPFRGFSDRTVVEYLVREEVRQRFGVEIDFFDCRNNPFRSWESRWRQDWFNDGLEDWWLDIGFSSPVTGPVFLKNKQGLGSGLLIPATLQLSKEGK